MDTSPEEIQSPQQFGVRVEDSHAIYVLLANSRSFVITKSETTEEAPPPRNTREQLSTTILDGYGGFLSSEATIARLASPDPFAEEPTYSFSSVIVFSEKEGHQSPYGYYSPDRLRKVKEILEGDGIRVDLRDQERGVMLIQGGDGSIIEIDFGYVSREAHGISIRQDIEKTEDPARRQELLKSALFYSEIGNLSIFVSLFGDEESGFLELGNEDSFTKNLLFYSDTYDKLLKALYQEKGALLPTNLVVLKSPYDVSTTLKLE